MDYPGGVFEAFGYDAADNISRYEGPMGVEDREHDLAEQLTRITRDGQVLAVLEHDQRGNLRLDRRPAGTRELAWNSRSQLLSVRRNGTSLMEATYQDDYRLQTLTTPEGVATVLWNFGNILSLFSPTGVEQEFLLSLPELDSPLERSRLGTGHETLLTDHLMTALASIDDTGAVIRETEFLAYGTVRNGVDPSSIGLAGARRDPATTLKKLTARIALCGLLGPIVGGLLTIQELFEIYRDIEAELGPFL